ncbi:MAG: ABC transporter ATP-binding protein [Planctomycetota bacterium]|jgi:putative ABC transport system ATP-binding protein|nr:ABC transporter ATP-binding protein [Planctomycetota bacterium]
MKLLSLHDLKKAYSSPDGSTTPIINIQHFEMDRAEQIALSGTSGSGKTTLLNLIAGIQRPDHGQIRIEGTDIASLSESARDRFRAKNLGYVFQSFNLLQGFTALENVVLGMMFGPDENTSQAQDLLCNLGLSDRLHYRPSQLSIGQQQRVALARALAGSPRLVLADEPTGNLDSRRAGESIDLIRSTCQERGAALLVVSHSPDILDRFDRVSDLTELNRTESSPENSAC